MLKFFAVFIFILLLGTPVWVWAQDSFDGTAGGGGRGNQTPDGQSVLTNPLPFETIPEVINKIIDFLAYLIGPIAVIMIVYAAYLFVLGGTNPDNVKKARSIILYTLIGIVVVVMSKAIVYVTCSILGISC